MKVTTYGMLTFNDCELSLRDDFVPDFMLRGDKEHFGVLLSEIPIDVKDITFGEFRISPLLRERQNFFKPYALLLVLPKKFDFLSAPLVGEVIATLLSFSLRRRIKACRMPLSRPVTAEGELREEIFIHLPSVSVGPEMSLQQPLTLGEQKKRISHMHVIFEKLMKMEKNDYLAVIRALHQYQLALLTYREDIGLAYTLLVSSIETMARQFVKIEDLKVNFNRLHDYQGWEKFFAEEGMSGDLSEEIRKRLIRRERFLSLRFRVFIENNLPKSFWTSPDSRAKEFEDYVESLRSKYFSEHRKEGPDHYRMWWWWLYDHERKPQREELENILIDIYDIRSKFSHIGVSPPTEVTDLFETAPIKIEFSNREQRLKFVRTPPSFFWFERVVHDSILNFVFKI